MFNYQSLSPALKKLTLYTIGIVTVSVLYFGYNSLSSPPTVERETFLSEIGEGVGEVAMWVFVFIYFRTLLKLIMGKGPISKRLIPEYKAPPQTSVLKKVVIYLDRTHVHVGIAAVALAALHISLMGQPFSNLFFIAVILLILWQIGFGFFLRWRNAPVSMKRLFLLSTRTTGHALATRTSTAQTPRSTDLNATKQGFTNFSCNNAELLLW